MRCIICGEGHQEFKKNIFDTRFGIPDNYTIAKCSSCGTLQTTPLPSSIQLKELYERYYNFSGEKGTTYTKVREWILSSIPYAIWTKLDGDITFCRQKGKGRLLDVGCNEGRGLESFKRNGYDAEGLELNDKAAKEARRKGFHIYPELIEDFKPEALYDIVVLSNVLEHSLDPKDMLSHVNRILKRGGEVWISCPNVNSWLRRLFGKFWINWHVPFHIVHFSRDTLTKLLETSGFQVHQCRQETPSLWVTHSVISRIFAVAGKPTRQIRNPIMVASLMLLIRSLLFPILWFGNLLNQGDCMVVVSKKV